MRSKWGAGVGSGGQNANRSLLQHFASQTAAIETKTRLIGRTPSGTALQKLSERRSQVTTKLMALIVAVKGRNRSN